MASTHRTRRLPAVLAAAAALGASSAHASLFFDDFETSTVAGDYMLFGDTLANANEVVEIIPDPGNAGNNLLQLVNFNNANAVPPAPQVTDLSVLSNDTFTITDGTKVTISADYFFGVAENGVGSSPDAVPTAGNILRLGVTNLASGGSTLGDRIEFSFLRNGGDTGTVNLIGGLISGQTTPTFNALFNIELAADPGQDGKLEFSFDLATGDLTASFAGETVNASTAIDLFDALGGNLDNTTFRAFLEQTQNGGTFVRGSAIDNLSIVPEPATGALALLGGTLLMARRRSA